MTYSVYNWVESCNTILWGPGFIIGIRSGRILTYWLNEKDLWLGKAKSPKHIRDISDKWYDIKSYMIIKSSIRLKMVYGGVKN